MFAFLDRISCTQGGVAWSCSRAQTSQYGTTLTLAVVLNFALTVSPILSVCVWSDQKPNPEPGNKLSEHVWLFEDNNKYLKVNAVIVYPSVGQYHIFFQWSFSIPYSANWEIMDSNGKPDCICSHSKAQPSQCAATLTLKRRKG